MYLAILVRDFKRLRDEFVCGINHKITQNKLFVKKLTMEQALEIAIQDELNIVTTYHGIKLCTNGSFNYAIQDRLTKANRAIYILKQSLSTNRNVFMSR